jgi:hypothetical protein
MIDIKEFEDVTPVHLPAPLRKQEFRPKKPAYPTLLRLKPLIESYQISVNTVELGLRYLRETAQASPDIAGFLLDTRKRLRIPSVLQDFDLVSRHAAEAYLVQTCHLFERFFTSMGREFRRFKQIENWKTQHGKNHLNALEAILENLPAKVAASIRALPEYDITTYYFGVRNALVHGNEPARIIERCDELTKKHKGHLKRRYSKLSAPNTPSILRFDDHHLLVHCALKLAANVNDACDFDVDDLVAHVTADGMEYRKALLLARGNRRSLEGTARKLASLHKIQTPDVDRFIHSIDQFLRGVPTHRERKRLRYQARKKRG